MLVPLIVLSLGAVFAGFVFHRDFIDSAGDSGTARWPMTSILIHAMHGVAAMGEADARPA